MHRFLAGDVAVEECGGNLGEFEALARRGIVIEKYAIGTEVDVVEEEVCRKVTAQAPLEFNYDSIAYNTGFTNQAVHKVFSRFILSS